jgi:putative hydrolase of the HAD superfamily
MSREHVRYQGARRFERTLIIDADDTLWENNVFYLRCTARFQDYMASLGYERDQTLDMLNACERETIPAMGYGPQSYIFSLGKACGRLLCESGRRDELVMIHQAQSCGELVLEPPMLLLAGVRSTLAALRPTTLLVLATKGDKALQRKKVRRSGLGPLFDAQYMLPEKDADAYRRILSELALDPGRTWMVGNSPKSDINPAVEAGMGAIFVPHDHTWTAEHQEIACPELVVTLARFGEMLAFFGIESQR